MPERRLPLRLASALALAALAALLAGGCGGGSAGTTVSTGAAGKLQGENPATLVLDFVPNGVHAGIYRALAAGYYADEGIDLSVVQPSSSSDALKLVEAGRAQFGISDGIDLATQIAAGSEVEGVMALLERPPGGLITLRKDGIADPRQLEGKTVGITGVPSDTAILDTVVSSAGGNPDELDVKTIGFNGVQDLESGQIAAFTGFVPADGVQVEQDGYPIRSFPLDEWGGPSYPGLVVFSTRQRIAAEPALMHAFVAATARGYEDVFADPRQGIEALVAANPAVDPRLATATLAAYRPLFRGSAKRYGEFQRPKIAALSSFMVERDLAPQPFPPSRFGTNRFLDGSP